MSTTREASPDSTKPMPAGLRPRAGKDERRLSARIPLAGTVKMGPPSGQPYASVSARDLSTGGLFIDADRPVRVGARFSAEVPLPSGRMIYVPEAEVLYNRDHATGSGFGVRFVDAPSEVTRTIESEIEKAQVATQPDLPPFEVKLSKRFVSAKQARVAPEEENVTQLLEKAPSQINLQIDAPNEPSIGDDLEIPSALPRDSRPPMFERARDIWEDAKIMTQNARIELVERSRRTPILWTTMAAIGASLVLSAIILALWMGSNAEAVEKRHGDSDRGVSAVTHKALMGEQRLPEVDAPAPAAERPAAAAKNPLPPLVYVDELDQESAAAMDARLGTAAPAVATAAANTAGAIAPRDIAAAKVGGADAPRDVAALKVGGADAPRDGATAKIAAVAARHDLPGAKAGAADTVDGVNAKVSGDAAFDGAPPAGQLATHGVPSAERGVTGATREALAATDVAPKVARALPSATETDQRLAQLSRGVVATDVPPPALRVERAAPKAAPTRARAPLRLSMPLAKHARVVKTHVLHKPERFVIDIAGQDSRPALAIGGAVKDMRFGKHEGFSRIVIETRDVIVAGRVAKVGQQLNVTLDQR